MRAARILHTLALASWWLGLILGVPGLLLLNPLLVSLAAVAVPAGFFLDDVANSRSGGLTAMTAYSAAAAATSWANSVALLAANSPARGKYYLYVSEPHVFLAMCLALAAAVLPPLAFRVTTASRTATVFLDLLPRVRGRVSDRQLVGGGVALGLLAVMVHARWYLGGIGALSSLISLAPLFVAFVLARAGSARPVRGALAGAAVVAAAEAARALFFGYLRGDVAAPFVAYALGALAGARSLRPLKSKSFLPLYTFSAIFAVYFAAFGAVRSSTSAGAQRLLAANEFLTQDQGAGDAGQQTVLSRLTTINQLSQVGRLAEEDGFLHGQTLDYLAYAFVPRFLWPGKPSIVKGQWFALNIGQAYLAPDGRVNNSVNMTIPGELYLNYGWSGVVVGLLFLGAFIAAFWRTTGFWQDSANVLGAAFGFYLMWPWIGFSLGADLQILVTIIAIYMLLVVLGHFLPAHGSLERVAPLRAAAVAASRLDA